jgi:hypothetical protein
MGFDFCSPLVSTGLQQRHNSGRGCECPGHAFTGEWFDVAGRIAQQEQSMSGDARRCSSQWDGAFD